MEQGCNSNTGSTTIRQRLSNSYRRRIWYPAARRLRRAMCSSTSLRRLACTLADISSRRPNPHTSRPTYLLRNHHRTTARIGLR